MVQPGLIESILTELHLLDDSEPKDTPSWVSSSMAPQQDSWNYCIIIIKLNSLAQRICPGISFATHQCTCYSSNPNKLAIKCIGQYLFWTKFKGLILHPKPDFWLDMYEDTDFSGL